MSGLNDPFRPGVEQPDGLLKSGFERTIAFFDWYPSADHQLSPEPRGGSDTTDSYTVDFAHASSNDPRWDQFGRQAYGDRKEADRRALVYTGEPVLQEMDITGSPVVSLEVASSATDGLFIGYLELVAPDGRVFYVTEGVLGARHRAVANEPPPYFQFGPYHSMSRADAAPLVPGQVTTIAFDLLATSVLVPKGWRIRLAWPVTMIAASFGFPRTARRCGRFTAVAPAPRSSIYRSGGCRPSREPRPQGQTVATPPATPLPPLRSDGDRHKPTSLQSSDRARCLRSCRS